MADKAVKIITPVITGLSPGKGKTGDIIKIVGTGFGDGNNIHGVFFNGIAADDWHCDSDTMLSGVKVPDVPPEGPGLAEVTVRTEGGIDNFGGTPQESAPINFEFTA